MEAMTGHPSLDLSAYLDGALGAAERASVQTHLDACEPCGRRLAELRATRALIAELPAPRASRSLVPRFERRTNWLRPLRSLSTFASGAFGFLFLASAVLATGSGLGGGGTGSLFRQTGPAAAPAPATQPQADTAEKRTLSGPTQAPFPAAIPAPQLATERSAQATSVVPAAAPAATQVTARSDSAEAERVPAGSERQALGADRLEIGPNPFLWLGLAFISAVVALGAHVRLRSSAQRI